MAGINVGGSMQGKKPLDVEVPLVPFIDLLLCCVMFLLVTAVWNQLAAIEPHNASTSADPTAPATEADFVRVRVTANGYRIEESLGSVESVPRAEGELDAEGLLQVLDARGLDAGGLGVLVAPDDGTTHIEVVRTLDRLIGGGYTNVSVGAS